MSKQLAKVVGYTILVWHPETFGEWAWMVSFIMAVNFTEFYLNKNAFQILPLALPVYGG